MAIRNQLPPWHERMRLANGREILIRPIRPEDAAPLRASFPLLGPEEVRLRYHHAVSELSEAETATFTQPDPRTDFVLVAAEPYAPGEALVGAVARAYTVPGTKDAEFAILVSRYVHGMGLGRHLLQRLARWAKGRGLERLTGDVLQENLPMLHLADSLGFQIDRERSNETLVRVVLDLSDTEGDSTEVEAA